MIIRPMDFVCIEYPITIRSQHYKLTLRPELYKEEDGYDFTGCYEGILTSAEKTESIFVRPDYRMVNGKEVCEWELEPDTINPEILPFIVTHIHEFHNKSADKAMLN